MERRVLLAFLLSFLVFLLFVRFFGPEEPPPPGPAASEYAPVAPAPGALAPGAAAPPAADAPSAADPAPGGDPAAPAAPVREAEREQRIAVHTDLYRAEITNRGGRLLSLELLEHTDSVGNPYRMVPQGDDLVAAVRPLDVSLPGERAPERLTAALFEVEVDGQSRSGPVSVEARAGESREVTLLYAAADGLEARKTIRIQGGEYRLGVSVSVTRGGAEQAKEILFGPGIGDETATGTYIVADQGVLKSAGQSELFSWQEAAGGEASSLAAQAVGVSSHYFAGLLVAEPGQRYQGRLDAAEIPWTSFQTPPEDAAGSRPVITARLATGGPASLSLFAGPKQVEVLADLGVDIVEFGSYLRFLVVPLRGALLWAYGVLGNYGWAIVLVTIVISILLAPLKHYSYVSIRGMQKISPQVKRIQEKYRAYKPTDPKRREMNAEMAGLYKEHGVSPIGGCLPMVLMIPFFFAFYRLLVVSVELRHAPFLGWVQDLSREDPYFILPILMGVSQLVMQKMSATQAEGIQAKIMMLMPVVFTLILAWAPAGLVLYWFSNNLLSMGQQAITTRILNRREEAAAEAEKKSKRAGKPGKPAARLRAASSGRPSAR